MPHGMNLSEPCRTAGLKNGIESVNRTVSMTIKVYSEAYRAVLDEEQLKNHSEAYIYDDFLYDI